MCLACEANVEEDIVPVGEDEIEEPETCSETVFFATQVKPIIDTNCIGCHGGSRFPNLSTYSGVSGSASQVQAQVVSRNMPQGGSLTSQEIELINCWVEQGAQNN